MKLLFDENISDQLVGFLSDEFPQSTHVRTVGLRGASDREIWEFARQHGFAIVSKDTDFRDRSAVDSAPPKIVWLDVGNAGTKAVEELLRFERLRIERFGVSTEASFLILSLGANAI